MDLMDNNSDLMRSGHSDEPQSSALSNYHNVKKEKNVVEILLQMDLQTPASL